MSSVTPGNLNGYRVLDLSHEPGFLAGMLLAQLGADVIKVEPPSGDPARRRGPFVGGIEDRERSILWLALNTSKRGITLDLIAGRGRALFLELCRRADVVLDAAGPDVGSSLSLAGLDYPQLRVANPRIVLCTISPYGRTGPHRDQRGSDLSAIARGGNLYPTGNPERAPVRCALPVSYYHGGIEAAVGVSFALWGRERSGEGQHVDVSLQEVMCMPNMTTPTQLPFTGFRGGRVGGGFRGAKAAFRELWPCRDGYVSFALRGGPARIPGILALVRYMDEAGMAPPVLTERDWTKYNHNVITQPEVDAIEAALGAFFATRTMSELFAAACERNLMLAPANTAREIVASRQAAAREFFVEIDHAGLGVRLRYPGAFAKNNLGNIRVTGPAPLLGQHNAEVFSEIGCTDSELRAEGLL